jgi:hypothetical protein
VREKGKPPAPFNVASDGIAISADGATLYYCQQKVGVGLGVGPGVSANLIGLVRHAAAAIESGLCKTVLITHGESGPRHSRAFPVRQTQTQTIADRRAPLPQFQQPAN